MLHCSASDGNERGTDALRVGRKRRAPRLPHRLRKHGPACRCCAVEQDRRRAGPNEEQHREGRPPTGLGRVDTAFAEVAESTSTPSSRCCQAVRRTSDPANIHAAVMTTRYSGLNTRLSTRKTTANIAAVAAPGPHVVTRPCGDEQRGRHGVALHRQVAASGQTGTIAAPQTPPSSRTRPGTLKGMYGSDSPISPHVVSRGLTSPRRARARPRRRATTGCAPRADS